MNNTADKNHVEGGRLESEELASLIVDALLRAHIVKEEEVSRAIKIATEEIEARKSLGDY